jgi:16S rRNA (cytosine1402-N4)-methyltransferase
LDSNYHNPVLVSETIAYLVTDPAGVYLDCTIGGGGHSEALLKQLNQGKIIGIDRDPEAIRFCAERFRGYDQQVQLFQGAFGGMGQFLKLAGETAVDGILLDLGVSSHQIDTPSRGFSYLQDGPLDMRMNPSESYSAREILNTWDEADLADLFFYYGEERYSRQIARLIVMKRDREPLNTTLDFADLIRSRVHGSKVNKTLARLFQALRIQVNDELEQLKSGLQSGADLLRVGGHMVVLSYHSLEDRLVKRFFRGEEMSIRKDSVEPTGMKRFKMLHKKVVRAGDEDIRRNPRSRAVRLRAAEKIA